MAQRQDIDRHQSLEIGLRSMKVSIVTAVFNRPATIAAAMESVQSQTYSDVEHVIQDGGSTDDTLAIVRENANDRTSLFSEPDRGIYDALNKGIQNATGEIVGIMHSDDFYADPLVLEKVVGKFSDPAVDMVYGDLEYVSSHDATKVVRYWRSGPFNEKRIRAGWMPPHPTVYLRRRVFENWGLYDTSFSIAADYDAMLRYLVKGRVVCAYIPQVLVRMRLGGASNRSLGDVLKKTREDYAAIRKNEVGGLPTLFSKNFSKLGQFVKRQ